MSSRLAFPHKLIIISKMFNMILALTLLIPLDIMPPSFYIRMRRQVT